MTAASPGSEDTPEDIASLRLENARLRTRERELSVLFSSARELAELRDADAMLERLVARASEIMDVDVAYLSEFDRDSQELRVRNTSGSVSAAFQHLRVPPGAGLASAIVESRAPQWTAEYSRYRAERHDAGIDGAVAAEGLVSLLGVPMLSDGDILGVLFVAHRTTHDFTPAEVALLSALADHASVVLQTARTVRDLRESEESARQTLARLTEHLTERDRAHTVHQRLVQAVLEGGGFAPVADTLAAALARPVALVDARGIPLAVAGGTLPPGMASPSPALLEAVDDSRATGRCVTVDEPDVVAVAALAAGAQHFGALFIGSGAFPLGAVDLRTVERASQVGALLALQQEALAGADHRGQSDLLADLLDDIPERRDDIERRARRLGVDIDALDTVAVFIMPGDLRTPSAREISSALGGRGLVGEHRGAVIAAYRHDPAVTVDDLHRRVRAAIAQPVLAIGTPPGRASLGEMAVRAHRTARVVGALDVHDGVIDTDDYLPYAALFDGDPRGLAAYQRQTIGAVRAYDAQRGTDLIGTLRAFVRNGASPTRTARALTFHPNTILQRLERLDHVLGPDWRDDERLFRISVAVRMDELAARLRPDEHRD